MRGYLEDEDFRESTDRIRVLTRYPNSHHSSPLVIYPQRHILNLYGGAPDSPATKKFLDTVSRMRTIAKKIPGFLGYTDCSAPIFAQILTNTRCTHFDRLNDDDLANLASSMRTSLNDIKADLACVQEYNPGLTALTTLAILPEADIQSVASGMSHTFSLYRQLVHIRSCFQRATINTNNALYGPYPLLNWNVFFDLSVIFIISTHERKHGVILNYDQWIMMTDTVSCRFLSLLSCEINERIQLESLPPSQLIRDVYKWGDDLLRAHGELGYSVIGEFEAFVTGIFVSYPETDPLRLGDDYLHSLYANAHANYRDTGVSVSWTNQIIQLLRTVSSPNYLSELFGLRKHWGNPIVSAEESGRSVQERVMEDLHISGPALEKLLASFNRMICLEYIRIHGCWPECYFKGDADYPLKTAQIRGITRVPEHMPDHEHLHWALLTFRSNCILDSYADQLSLLSDKSVSVYREHVGSIYIVALSSHLARVSVPESRRLILEFIRRNHMSVCDIFKIVMTHTIPMSWLCNSAAMKGTEMKRLKARIFAVLTFELRQYFAATEDILRTQVFKYNPHQTMTLNENQLLAKLRDITRQMNVSSDSHSLHVIHIIDFSKWNLRMKYANTCLVFKSIDNFLGTPGLIESTHNIFWELLNVIQDPFNPPKSEPSDTASDVIWRMHDCGWEGQRQKGWTLLTSALLSDVERVTGVYSQICGQGDNQVLLSKFPVPAQHSNAAAWLRESPGEVKRLVDQFYWSLEEECTAIGLRVKTAETCRSLSFFNYGKRLYFNGIELSMSLKRISKSATEPNDSYPTTESRLKTLEGTVYASGLFSHPGILPYLLSRITLYLAIMEAMTDNPLTASMGRRILEERGLRLSPRFISILMKIPSGLGGPPQLPFSAYLYRGHPDNLCTDLVLLIMRARNGCEISRRIVTVVESGIWFERTDEDLKTLLLAPHSLNITLPRSALSPIEQEVSVALRCSCHNADLKSIFSLTTEAYEKQIVKLLSTAKPMQPAVLNDIYGRTLAGRRQSFITGLRNTTSLGRLISDDGLIPLHARVTDLERQQLFFWISRVVDVSSANPASQSWFRLDPHWIVVQRWRDQSWGRRIEGVTVPHPLEQFKLVRAEHDLCHDHILALPPEHIVIVRHSEGLITLPGIDSDKVQLIRSDTGSPYLGSTVSEGIIQRDVDCLNPSEPWRDSIRLNMIRLWVCQEGSILDSLLQKIITTRTNTPLTLLNQATGKPSRLSYNHRALLMATTRTCAPTSTTNMHSRVYLSSNRMGEFSHGDVNYHMPFGPCFLNSQMLIAMDGVAASATNNWGAQERVIFHVHVRRTVNPIVYDGVMDIKGSLSTLCAPKPPKLLFADVTELALMQTSVLSLHEVWSPMNIVSIPVARDCYCHQLLGDIVLQETVVRESLTVNMMGDYVHRENPIAIGDIKLVTAKRLIHALSITLILVTPLGVGDMHHQDSLCASMHAFLDTFSWSFWTQLTPAFLNYDNLRELQELCPVVTSFRITRSTAGVIVLLKAALCTTAWRIIFNLSECLLFNEELTEWAIFAPGLHSGKFLWSKFVEFCCFIVFPRVGASERDTVDIARDLSAEINSGPVESITPMMWRIREQFVTCSRRFTNDTRYVIPVLSFFNLCEPWIDRLRGHVREEIVFTTPPANRLTHLRTGNVSVHHIVSGVQELLTSQTTCSCVPTSRSLQPHYECFFMPTGLLSKSHYRFLEVICELRLDPKCVVCLGSSTGSEAASLSMLEECHNVYVNCLLPITAFAPHTAGSYIPPAFLIDGHPGKLISSSNSAVTVNDLLLTETLTTISEHTRSFQPTGVTCDVELPDEDNSNIQMRLVAQLVRLTIMLPSISWLVVKVVLGCVHDLERLIGMLGHQFGHVAITVSAFSKARSKQVFIGCYGRFDRVVPLPLEPPQVQLNGAGQQAWDELVVPSLRREYPGIFYLDPPAQKQLMSMTSPCRSSLPVACSALVEGWGLGYRRAPTRHQAFDDLDRVSTALNSHALQLIGSFSRVAQDFSMVRSQILIIEDDNLEKQVQHVGEKYIRAQLMMKLLEQEKVSLRTCMVTINHFITCDQFLPLRTQPFLIRNNATRLTNYHSRHIFEVLGHIYSHSVEIEPDDPWSNSLHLSRPIVTHTDKSQLPYTLSVIDQTPRTDFRWSWSRRAKILSFLMARTITGTQVTNVWLSDSHLHETKLIPGNDIANYHVCQLTDVNCELAWINSHASLTKLLSSSARPPLICGSIMLYTRLAHQSTISQIYALPWCGVYPQTVMYNCVWGGVTTISTGFPNTNEPNEHGWLVGRELIGCCCYSCSLEVCLLAEHRLDHSRLDRVCSQRAIESIRDLRHFGY